MKYLTFKFHIHDPRRDMEFGTKAKFETIMANIGLRYSEGGNTFSFKKMTASAGVFFFPSRTIGFCQLPGTNIIAVYFKDVIWHRIMLAGPTIPDEYTLALALIDFIRDHAKISSLPEIRNRVGAKIKGKPVVNLFQDRD